MRITSLIIYLITINLYSCNYRNNTEPKTKENLNDTVNQINIKQISKMENSLTPTEKSLACKLTSAELRNRKETILASIKTKILEKKELGNGYSYRFDGTDANIEELTKFIKTERECCDFFGFSLTVNNDRTAWFSITGKEGAKDFIKTELEL